MKELAEELSGDCRRGRDSGMSAGRLDQGWISGTGSTPLQALTDSVDALRVADERASLHPLDTRPPR